MRLKRTTAASAVALALMMAPARPGAAAHSVTRHAAARPAHATTTPPRGPTCEQTAGNLVQNCAFASGLDGWQPQAATTFHYQATAGHRAPGALEMVNEPASEAGAGTCVALAGGKTYELSGYLQRLQGSGECVAFLEEHTATDCGGGATHFHEMVSTPLARAAFTRVAGTAALAADTQAVKAGFACYGEQDDDVSGVLLDDVVLRAVSGR